MKQFKAQFMDNNYIRYFKIKASNIVSAIQQVETITNYRVIQIEEILDDLHFGEFEEY